MATLLPRIRAALPEASGTEAATLDPVALFGTPEFGPAVDEVWLEIGFGAGEHVAAQAALRPRTGIIGCEVFENGVAKLLAEIDRRHLGNVRILMDDARLLLACLPAASLGRAFILFPDPWPKERHKKRRIVSTETLDRLALALRDGAELRLATDDVDYASWMLERATAHPAFEWLARRPSDWRDRPADWPPTRYERKAIAAGRRPVFLRFRRRDRAA